MTDIGSVGESLSVSPTDRDLQAVIDVAQQSVEGQVIEDGTLVAFTVPAGGAVVKIDRDTDADRARRGDPPAKSKAGTTVVRDAMTLVQVVERWGRNEATVAYADPVTRRVETVLNDDENGHNPGWRDRRVVLDLIETPEWKRWKTLDRRMIDQRAFAEHIEDSLEDISSPPAADMLELAQTLEATIGVKFGSGVRLQSGQRQFTYTEETDARAGRTGELTIPDLFTIRLAIWQAGDAEPIAIDCRLRYRISSDGLKLGYVMNNVDRVLADRFVAEVIDPLESNGLTVVRGSTQ